MALTCQAFLLLWDGAVVFRDQMADDGAPNLITEMWGYTEVEAFVSCKLQGTVYVRGVVVRRVALTKKEYPTSPPWHQTLNPQK